MYEYIIGKFMGICQDYVIIENNGIGYKVFSSGYTMSKLPQIEKEVKLNLIQIVREDFIGLYGFIDKEEVDLFRVLINVNGVGAKSALSLLSIASPENLKRAIVFEEEALLLRAPGIGKKSAQRIILELKDKFKHEDFSNENKEVKTSAVDVDALAALESLGFAKKEVEKVLEEIDNNLSIEDIIKEALKSLMR